MTEPRDNPASREPGWERSLIERLAFAALEEQRRARRWSLFFKLFFVSLLTLLVLSSLAHQWGQKALAGRHSALIDMEGVIEVDNKASADAVITSLRAAFENALTAGVILRVNSPGGSPVQSAYINDEIVRLRKKHPDTPLYAVISDICASGCYYVVAAADKIYANKASLVGSIGVLMDGFGFVDSLRKLGIERRLLTAGENKAFLDPFSPMQPQHRRFVQGLLAEIHQQFIDQVKTGRGPALKESKELFSGLIWTGETAKKLGLVDDFGSASYVAREVIGAETIVDFTTHQDWFERFADRMGAATAKALDTRWRQGTPALK